MPFSIFHLINQKYGVYASYSCDYVQVPQEGGSGGYARELSWDDEDSSEGIINSYYIWLLSDLHLLSRFLAGFATCILTSYLITQDGKPYILSIEAGPTSDDANPNFNFVGKSVFKNLEDMRYYENECVAHKTLKAKAASELELEGIMTVYYAPTFSASL